MNIKYYFPIVFVCVFLLLLIPAIVILTNTSYGTFISEYWLFIIIITGLTIPIILRALNTKIGVMESKVLQQDPQYLKYLGTKNIKVIAFIWLGIFLLITLILSYKGALENNPTSSQNKSEIIWNTYTSNKYGYSFEYPDKWKITEEEASDGIEVATNLNIFNEKDIQIIGIDKIPLGIGCSNVNTVNEESFTIGEVNIKKNDFCGSNLYFIDGIIENGDQIQLAIYFSATSLSDEDLARDILKSIKGIEFE